MWRRTVDKLRGGRLPDSHTERGSASSSRCAPSRSGKVSLGCCCCWLSGVSLDTSCFGGMSIWSPEDFWPRSAKGAKDKAMTPLSLTFLSVVRSFPSCLTLAGRLGSEAACWRVWGWGCCDEEETVASLDGVGDPPCYSKKVEELVMANTWWRQFIKDVIQDS